MGIGVSLFLIAAGAVLRFAVSTSTDGVNLQTVGVILMLVGGAGMLLSLLFWSTWGGFGSRRTTTMTSYDAPVATTRRREIIDEY
jgi:hypothetical protein